MNEGLRVLIVEDNSTDAEINEREVRRVLPDSQFRCVEAREDFIQALGSFRPDVILCDYSLPQFDGMTALALALERGQGERVLLVEDEEGARKGLTKVLTVLGYQATAVGSGEEALALGATPGFDLLLSDLMLPGIGGDELAAQLGERWPALKIILMSGYTEDMAVRRDVEERAVRFLQKPFDMAALAREVREALDAVEGGTSMALTERDG